MQLFRVAVYRVNFGTHALTAVQVIGIVAKGEAVRPCSCNHPLDTHDHRAV